MSLTKVSYSLINGSPSNVLDYGAVGDGVANDTTAFINCFNASFDTYIPTGIYKLTTAINSFPQYSPRTIYGSQNAELRLYTLQLGDGTSSGQYKYVVENLYINGNGTIVAPATGALYINAAHKGSFKDVRITGYTAVGNSSPLVVRYGFVNSFYNLSVQGNLYGPTIKEVSNAVAFYQGTFANNTNFGAYIRTSNVVTFNTCNFEANIGDGVTVDNILQATEGQCSNIVFDNCYFENNAGTDIRVGTGGGGDTTTVKNTIIRNCWFVNTNTAPYIGSPQYAITLGYSTDAVIENCKFDNSFGGYTKYIKLDANSKNTTIIPFDSAFCAITAGATVSTKTIQTGLQSIVLNGSGTGSATITLPVPYEVASPPVLLTMATTSAAPGNLGTCQVESLANTGFVIRVFGGPASGTVSVAWRVGS
jgi:hypothetical protein